MFIARISEQVRKALFCAALGHCAGLAGAEVISFIVAGMELCFGLALNCSPMLTTIL